MHFSLLEGPKTDTIDAWTAPGPWGDPPRKYIDNYIVHYIDTYELYALLESPPPKYIDNYICIICIHMHYIH